MQKKHLLTGLTGLAATGLAFYLVKTRSGNISHEPISQRAMKAKHAPVPGKMSPKNSFAYLYDLSIYDDRPE